MESCSANICIIPFQTKQDGVSLQRVFLLPNPEDVSQQLLLQEEMDKRDPSTIFAATRIFLKNAVDLAKFPSLVFDEKTQDFAWEDTTYNTLLGNMARAPIAEYDGKIVFFYKIDDATILRENYLEPVTIREFDAYFPALSKELKDALDAEVTASWPSYAVFVCQPDRLWFHNYNALYKGLYHGPGESWKAYRITMSEFPTEEELTRLKGVVLSGSNLSAYADDVAWFGDFRKLIRRIIDTQPHTKLMGVCFGHQFIAEALGGKVEKMGLTEYPQLMNRETVNFRGSQNETINRMIENFAKNYEFNVVKIHGDHVVKLPPGANLLASSNLVGVEMYEVGNRVLCSQFHPEFNAYVMEKSVYPEVLDTFPHWPNIEEIVGFYKKQLSEARCDNREINNLFRTFLKA